MTAGKSKPAAGKMENRTEREPILNRAEIDKKVILKMVNLPLLSEMKKQKLTNILMNSLVIK